MLKKSLLLLLIVSYKVPLAAMPNISATASAIKATLNNLLPSSALRWDWVAINPKQENFLATLSFPKGFKWGVADSAFQVEGPYYGDGKKVKNNWTEFKDYATTNYGMGTDEPEHFCERWSRWQEDVQLLADSGFTRYRFSISWEKLNPAPGVFDEEVMQHYKEYVDALVAHGIEPIVCLFHHTWPLWIDELGAFENREVINHFAAYAAYVCQHLHDKVNTWMTINEPMGYALSGYFVGTIPPGKKSLKLCGIVAKNLLDGHIAAYKAMKKINPTIQIGFPHVIQHIDAYHPYNPVEQALASLFDYLTNDVVIEYFRTGEFKWEIPSKTLHIAQGAGASCAATLACLHGSHNTLAQTALGLIIGTATAQGLGTFFELHDFNPEARHCLDYIGVNYYAHSSICMSLSLKEFIKPQPYPGELVTDNNQVIYPEGMYRAIVRCAKLGLPMHVAENGVADNHDQYKKQYIRTHLYAVAQAIADGYKIDSYFFWTLMDNFEWGKKDRFGLYHVDFATQQRTLKPGAQEFVEFVRAHKQ